MAKDDIQKFKYKKGQTGNPNGRPKKTIRIMLEQFTESGLEVPTTNQIKDAYLSLATMAEDELKKLLGDKDSPMLLRICATNLLSKKGFDIVEKMLDRAIGKATQKTEVTGENGSPILMQYDLSKLSLDELRQLKSITTKLETD
jgi:hypothetical protein